MCRRFLTMILATGLALAALPVLAQTSAQPRTLVLIDTSQSMTQHLTDTCNSGGDGTVFTDPYITMPYQGLPAPVNTSGCMFTCTSNTFDGINSRLYAAKTAFTKTLTSFTNIDWGLMRFSGTDCATGGTFQPRTCTSGSQCGSGTCSGGHCIASSRLQCLSGEVVAGGICGTDTNLCRTAGSSYQEANCSTTHSQPLSYTGSCGVAGTAGAGACATLQTCFTDADCNSGAAGSCVAYPGSASKVCSGARGFSCPTGYVSVNGFCQYNLACQDQGAVFLVDPLARDLATVKKYIDNHEDYTPNSFNLPTDPELHADGSAPLAGAIRTATAWYESAVQRDPMAQCRPYSLVLLIDGFDTCDANTTTGPVAAAQGFVAATVQGNAQKPLNRIYLIGLNVSSPTLDKIAYAGGTTSSHLATSEADIENLLASISASMLPSLSVTGSTTICGSGTAGTATFTGEQIGYRTTSGGPVTALTPTSAGTYVLKGSDFPGPGQYYLVAGRCSFSSATSEIAITVGGIPSAAITAPSSVAAGHSSIASVPDADNGASYTWTVSGAAFTGQGTRSITFTPAKSGSVSLSVVVQNAQGCSASGAATVPITPPSFTDDPLVAAGTAIKAIHLLEVRDSVNATRVKAGFAPAEWAENVVPGTPVRFDHIVELRNALTPALVQLGTTPSYTDPNLGGCPPCQWFVKAAHIQEIRDYTR